MPILHTHHVYIYKSSTKNIMLSILSRPKMHQRSLLLQATSVCIFLFAHLNKGVGLCPVVKEVNVRINYYIVELFCVARVILSLVIKFYTIYVEF
jgi:hypothetical protein